MATLFSINYPPKNRKEAEGLDVIDVEIVSSEVTIQTDRNSAAIAGITEQLQLGAPIAPSVLSGAPGYIYRTHEVELVLTSEELFRFLRYGLRPDEFFLLADRYGVFFEIHNDFYDEETGEALQPFDREVAPAPTLH